MIPKAFLGADGGAPNPNAGTTSRGMEGKNVVKITISWRRSGSSSSAFWNLEYYQSYFDVDTKLVRAL